MLKCKLCKECEVCDECEVCKVCVVTCLLVVVSQVMLLSIRKEGRMLFLFFVFNKKKNDVVVY